MSITTLQIIQDNKSGNSDLIPAHSPISFIVRAQFTGTTPETLNIKLIDDDGNILDSLNAIPYRDLSSNVRDFIFIASKLIISFLPKFDDILEPLESFEFVENIIKNITIRFEDIENENMFVEIPLNFCNAVKQTGEFPNLIEQFNNLPDIYFCPSGFFCYVYFYNDNELNNIEINETQYSFNIASDYNDDTFVDYNDDEFEILTN